MFKTKLKFKIVAMKLYFFIGLILFNLSTYSQVFKMRVDTIGTVRLDTLKQKPIYQQANGLIVDDIPNKRITIYYSLSDSSYFDCLDFTTISVVPNDKIFLIHAIDDQKRNANITVQIGHNYSMSGLHDGIIQVLYPAIGIIYYFNYVAE